MKNNKNIKKIIGIILILYFAIPVILVVSKSIIDILGLYGMVNPTIDSNSLGTYSLRPPQRTPLLILLSGVALITALIMPLLHFIGGILLLKSKPMAKKFIITILGIDIILKFFLIISNFFIEIPGAESNPIKSFIFYIFIIFEVLTIFWLTKKGSQSKTA